MVAIRWPVISIDGLVWSTLQTMNDKMFNATEGAGRLAIRAGFC